MTDALEVTFSASDDDERCELCCRTFGVFDLAPVDVFLMLDTCIMPVSVFACEGCYCMTTVCDGGDA